MESVHVLLAQVGVAFQKLFFGAKRDAHGISASENILLDISFSPIKEGEIFSFYPYGEHSEDLFDIVYPSTNQAHRHNFILLMMQMKVVVMPMSPYLQINLKEIIIMVTK